MYEVIIIWDEKSNFTYKVVIIITLKKLNQYSNILYSNKKLTLKIWNSDEIYNIKYITWIYYILSHNSEIKSLNSDIISWLHNYDESKIIEILT